MLTAKRPKRMTNIKFKVNNTLNENSIPMKEPNFFLREGVERKLKPCSAVWVKNSLVRLYVYRSCDALRAFKRTLSELLFHGWKTGEEENGVVFYTQGLSTSSWAETALERGGKILETALMQWAEKQNVIIPAIIKAWDILSWVHERSQESF